MAGLSQRKEEILSAVTEYYISTGEPVGSKLLVTVLPFSVSSATVRNEMAELSSMGYLEQPHTSAGRIPSDLGLRYYVDRLPARSALPQNETFRILSMVDHTEGDAKAVLTQLCDIASELTGMAAAATTPFAPNAAINNVQVMPVGNRSALVLITTTAGVLKSRIAKLSVPADFRLMELFYNVAAANFIGAHCEDVTKAMVQSVTVKLGAQALDIAPLLVCLSEAIAESAEADVIVRGQKRLFDSPLRADAPGIIGLAADREKMLKLLRKNRTGDVRLLIGRENDEQCLQNASVVTAGYNAGENVSGVIGLIGPTKMDYARVLELLRSLASLAGELTAQPADDNAKE